MAGRHHREGASKGPNTQSKEPRMSKNGGFLFGFSPATGIHSRADGSITIRILDGKRSSIRKFFYRLRIGVGLLVLLSLILPIFWTSLLFAQPPISITFGADEVGKFPSGWLSMDGKSAVKVYSVQAEGDKKFLHADSKGSRVQIGLEKKWALKEFPILQWQWRAVLFPVGTNEREKSGNDSVLGIYVVFGHWPFIKAIKYIWSDTLPAGASFSSPFAKGTKILVVRSGRSLMGMWAMEKRDVLFDYQQLFGEEEKNPIASGIAILTDSDNTNSSAIGDYAAIQTRRPNGENPVRP